MAGESIGWKSELWMWPGTGPLTTLVKILGVTEITPPSPELDEVEVTDLDAPNRYRSFIPALRDPGMCEATVNYVGGSTTDTLLRAAFLAADIRPFKVIYSDDDGTPLRQISFRGYVKTLSEPTVSADSVKQVNLSIRVSGEPVEGAAT